MWPSSAMAVFPSGYDSADSIDSGCPEAGVTGWYKVVSSSGVTQEVFIVDDHQDATTGGDGLPDELWCPGDTTATTLSVTGASQCQDATDLNTVLASATNCAFDFAVWVGSSGGDGSSGSPIDCTDIETEHPTWTFPVMMFGGGGSDYLTGTAYGDYIDGGNADDTLRGGDGDDYLCGGSTRTGYDNNIYGEAGDDRVFGGPKTDVIYGGTGDDTIMAAMGADTVNCGDDDDACHGAFDADTINGGDGDDLLFGGIGNHTMDGGNGNDSLLSQDNYADTHLDGDAGTDACWRDSNGGGPTDSITSCIGTDLEVCNLTYKLLVSTNDGTDATLNELDLEGVRGEYGTVKVGTKLADKILGMAVDPTTCVLWLLAQEESDQKILTIDTEAAGQPSSNVYTATSIGNVPDDDLVDIAFGSRGWLAGLESGGDVVRINKSSAAKMSEHGHVGRAGATGLRMAYDASDAGLFFVLTSTDSGTTFDVDILSMFNDVTLAGEDHVDWVDPWPFTNVPFIDSSGVMLTIDDTADAGGDYPMWDVSRRNWGGTLSGGNAVSNLRAWDINSTCAGDQCAAELDDPPDAIAAPLWMDD